MPFVLRITGSIDIYYTHVLGFAEPCAFQHNESPTCYFSFLLPSFLFIRLKLRVMFVLFYMIQFIIFIALIIFQTIFNLVIYLLSILLLLKLNSGWLLHFMILFSNGVCFDIWFDLDWLHDMSDLHCEIIYLE